VTARAPFVITTTSTGSVGWRRWRTEEEAAAADGAFVVRSSFRIQEEEEEEVVSMQRAGTSTETTRSDASNADASYPLRNDART